jgi:hypothetical protein
MTRRTRADNRIDHIPVGQAPLPVDSLRCQARCAAARTTPGVPCVYPDFVSAVFAMYGDAQGPLARKAPAVPAEFARLGPPWPVRPRREELASRVTSFR